MFGEFPENPSEKFFKKFSNESFSIASETTIQKKFKKLPEKFQRNL